MRAKHLGIAPREMLMIGDSLNDTQAARAAGCPVFCVPYGYNEGRDVRELDVDAIVETLLEATTLITEIMIPIEKRKNDRLLHPAATPVARRSGTLARVIVALVPVSFALVLMEWRHDRNAIQPACGRGL